MAAENVHPHEIKKFGSLAERWWDTQGEFKTLHDVNPLRIGFILDHADISGKRLLDVGCGGGILSEGLAKQGADVIGIDLSEELIDIADLHSLESRVPVKYQTISVEALAEKEPSGFDYITCMEMLEHVPNPESVVHACARLVKPGGKIFFSTLNRNAKAYLLAIVSAEYLLRMIPKGTHNYKAFIRPSELAAWGRQVNLNLLKMTGIEYNPFYRRFYLGQNIDVNYITVYQKSD